MASDDPPDISGRFPCFANGCGGRFVRRQNRRDGRTFYGCSNFPHCTMTRFKEDVESEYTAKVIGEFDPEEPFFGM